MSGDVNLVNQDLKSIREGIWKFCLLQIAVCILDKVCESGLEVFFVRTTPWTDSMSAGIYASKKNSERCLPD